MRIAIDARMYGNEECSGIGTYIKNLTDNLFEIDKFNEYVLFLREPEFSRFIPPNERVKKIKVTPRWYTFREQTILPFQLAKEKFDLIHYPHFNSPIFFPKKSICTIHDTTPFSFPGHKMKSALRRAAYRAVFFGTLAKAKQVIAVSQKTKDEILAHFDLRPEKIKVIYEGVDERFKILDKNGTINEVKNKFALNKPFLLFVGIWRSHKNIEGLVHAFNILKKKYKIPHLLALAGREDLHHTKTRDEINQSPYKNDILTLGYVSDEEIPLLYNAANAFVLASFIEGFGLIALEAQNCGCPVVSTNRGAMPEILQNSALFFDPSNDEKMAEAIWRIISDAALRNKLISDGIKNAKRFSWRRCAEETLKIYESAASNF